MYTFASANPALFNVSSLCSLLPPKGNTLDHLKLTEPQVDLVHIASLMIVFFSSSIFAFFLQLMCIFSNPHPPLFFSNFSILCCSERVLYSARLYSLSGCANVPTNRPIPAHSPHPSRPAPHLTPPPPKPRPTRPHPASHLTPPGLARPTIPSPPRPTRARAPPASPPLKIVGSCRTCLLTCGAGAA